MCRFPARMAIFLFAIAFRQALGSAWLYSALGKITVGSADLASSFSAHVEECGTLPPVPIHRVLP
jgi:hypothetical protein